MSRSVESQKVIDETERYLKNLRLVLLAEREHLDTLEREYKLRGIRVREQENELKRLQNALDTMYQVLK